MADRLPLPPPKFCVGQRCCLVLDESSGWAELDGEECTIIEGRIIKKRSWCENSDGSNGKWRHNIERYLVRYGNDADLYVREHQLRPINDGNHRSTWEEFAQCTGCDPRRAAIREAREVDHG